MLNSHNGFCVGRKGWDEVGRERLIPGLVWINWYANQDDRRLYNYKLRIIYAQE